MVSFDIVKLYTNVSLHDTLQICTDALYRDHLGPPIIPENLFLENMRLATDGIGFIFNNIMYAQIDGDSKGNPLGPMLANIFVGFDENHLFERHRKPTFTDLCTN